MKIKAGYIDTINDLEDNELKSKRNEFIKANYGVLSSYFTNLELQMLRHTFLSRFFWTVNEINIGDDLTTNSRYRFSRKEIKVPKTIDLASELLVKNKVITAGIFRVNSIPENVKSFITIVESMAAGHMNTELGLKMINHAFDIIDISESYKMLFRKFGHPVFPSAFLRMASQINESVSKEHKLICCKALIYGLPNQNRMILENCIFLCSLMASRFDNSKSNEHLNIVSLGVVMTPNLIDFSIEDFEFDFVKKLSHFISFLFENFTEIIEVN